MKLILKLMKWALVVGCGVFAFLLGAYTVQHGQETDAGIGVVGGIGQLIGLILFTVIFWVLVKRYNANPTKNRWVAIAFTSILAIVIFLSVNYWIVQINYEQNYRPWSTDELIEEIVNCRQFTAVPDDPNADYSVWSRVRFQDGRERLTLSTTVDLAREGAATRGAGPNCAR